MDHGSQKVVRQDRENQPALLFPGIMPSIFVKLSNSKGAHHVSDLRMLAMC